MSDSRNWFESVPEARVRRLHGAQRHGVCLQLDGRELINFAANDYLGLSFHPAVQQAAIESIKAQGFGSGASRLISGDDPQWHTLEMQMAAWKGYQACLVVGSGMLCNTGLLQALADRHTHIFSDKLNHASLVDGARLSGAVVHRYAHADLQQLEKLLMQHTGRRRIIVSDGVFSMDGDTADVAALLKLAEMHDALLLIDDAHGIGTLGSQGKGLCADVAAHPRLVEAGTFGKAFGSYGAFILGSHELIDGLRQRLRTLIYSTALPAAVSAASLAALALVREGALTAQLQRHVALFRELASDLPLMSSATAIQPLMVGEDADALAASARLREAGYFVPAIRPPTVPEHTARLRITLSAAHTQAQIAGLVRALREL